MRQILLQIATDIITKYGSCYYKMRQLLLQNATDITKCDSYLLQNAAGFFYYKMRELLQNATFITNCAVQLQIRRW